VTEPQGFADAVRRFSTELDAVVVRARRVAADARETSAKFRRETRQLAEQVRSGATKVPVDRLTDDRMRRTATGFRDDNGLPVRDLPPGGEVVERPPARPQPVTAPSPFRTTAPGRIPAGHNDDDEDFSNDQIMR
jgi:hypothetical protein